MKAEPLISASWFYMDEIEKCKFNWFLYEYACKLYEHIGGSRNRANGKWRARRGDTLVAEFCAYFAKRLRQDIFKHMTGALRGKLMDEDYVRDYCHDNTQRENDALMAACEKAWGELLESCAVCPVACLDDTAAYCEFFDRMERGGYLS